MYKLLKPKKIDSNTIIEKFELSLLSIFVLFLNQITPWYLFETFKPFQGGILENSCQSLEGRIMTLRFKSNYKSPEYGSKNK